MHPCMMWVMNRATVNGMMTITVSIMAVITTVMHRPVRPVPMIITQMIQVMYRLMGTGKCHEREKHQTC
ncbi:MAG TPA: hypothetical protein DIC22_05860 [Chitinophagaceae bacterium]|nr:hypothetical protein [Chitinophagaceae bacterium]